MKTFKKGDVVRYTEEWSRPEERHLLFVVTEAFDDVQRLHMGCLNTNIALGYMEVVTYEMVELAEA